MSTLNQKFTDEDLKNLCDRLNKLHREATHWDVRSSASESEIELLDTIDHLCRISNMFGMIMAQLLDGDIETGNPEAYISGKLSIAEASLKNFLKVRDLKFE